MSYFENGQRIITQSGVFKALDRPARGNSRVIGIPTFMDAKNLQPLITQDLRDVINKIEYIGKYGKTTSWKPNSLRSLLKNRIYYGVIEYKGEIYKGEHAPIITKETYDLAQIERAKRREITVKRTNNPRPFQSKYMLSGHLRCGYCGARITLYVSKARKDGTKLLKYYCVNRKKSCDSGLYLLNDLEDIVMSEIAKFKLDEDYMSRMTKQPKPEIDKEAIENEIADLDNRLNRLNDLYLNNMIDMEKLKKESSNIITTKKTFRTSLKLI